MKREVWGTWRRCHWSILELGATEWGPALRFLAGRAQRAAKTVNRHATRQFVFEGSVHDTDHSTSGSL